MSRLSLNFKIANSPPEIASHKFQNHPFEPVSEGVPNDEHLSRDWTAFGTTSRSGLGWSKLVKGISGPQRPFHVPQILDC